MKTSRLFLTCLLVPGFTLLAQPSPSPLETSKRLAAVGPEVEKLIGEFRFQEALTKAEELIPSKTEPYDGTSSAAAFNSAIAHYNYAQAYFLAFKAADAFGDWEKALGYIKKSQELAQLNKAETEKALTTPLKDWSELREKGKKVLDEHAARFAELKAKKNPTNAELNELDDYLSAEKNFQLGEENTKSLTFAWDRGTKYAKSYDAYVEYVQQKIQDQDKEIASYAPAKGDKAKWAEAIVQAPSYLKTITEEKEKIAFLFRLAFLAPESAKVKRAIDQALGKPVAPEPKEKKGKKK